MSKYYTAVASLVGMVGFAASASAGPVSDTLYYTTFGGGQNVWKVTGTYTGNGTSGNGTFSLTSDTGVATTPGADGIVFNPNNGNLLVGGQGNVIHQVNPTTGSFTSATPGMSAFELTVDPNKNVVWSGGQEGGDNRISSTPINPFGGAGTTQVVSGSVNSITHMTFTPALPAGTAFYTSSGDDGLNGHFGKINLGTGVATDIFSSTTGAGVGHKWHGMDYDPFTGDLILAGGNEIIQVDPTTGAIVSDLLLAAGQEFDQGAVDGQGHIFWADNNGNLLFLDYSTTSLVGDANNFVSDTFFKSQLDDIAPLSGAGGTPTPEPSSFLLLGVALSGIGLVRRRIGKRA